jgi:hypothetical protein
MVRHLEISVVSVFSVVNCFGPIDRGPAVHKRGIACAFCPSQSHCNAVLWITLSLHDRVM